MLEVGSKIKVKENAFTGSSEPNDFLMRGKVGEIIFDLGADEWEVQTEDGDFLILLTDEIEELENEQE